MSIFPRRDNEFMVIKAEAVAEDIPMIAQMHDMAEHQNQLFAFGHLSLAASAIDLFETEQHKAFVSGIRAYGVIGLDELDAEQHRRYSTVYVLNALAQMEKDGNFDLHFIESIEQTMRDLKTDVPQLGQAVEAIAQSELHDTSSELAQFSLYGAAMMRDAQLEVDRHLEAEKLEELEAMFNQ